MELARGRRRTSRPASTRPPCGSAACRTRNGSTARRSMPRRVRPCRRSSDDAAPSAPTYADCEHRVIIVGTRLDTRVERELLALIDTIDLILIDLQVSLQIDVQISRSRFADCALAVGANRQSDDAVDLEVFDRSAIRIAFQRCQSELHFGGPLDRALLVAALNNVATRLRIDSVRATSESGSGHPTSCCSAADLVAALFFAEMRFDPKDPQHPGSDRFVLSKGHAAPLLYAAWAEAGAFDRVGAAEAARADLRPRRASDAAAAVRRRRHRVARPGHLRRDRQRAERAPHQVGLPHLLPARRRRVGRRLGLGSGRSRRERRPRQPVRHHRRQRPRPEPRDDVAARHRAVRAPLARASAGTPSSSTATTWTRFSTPTPRPARPRAGRR